MRLQNEIIEEMAKHLGVTPQDIDLNASLTEDMGLGPIQLADLLTALSQKFELTFDPQETERLREVKDLVELVEDLSLE
jgi:acyl carrier protein